MIKANFTQLSQAWHVRKTLLIDRFQASWKQRTKREQRLLVAAALVVGLALIWFAAMRPALTTITQAQQHLPELRVQAAQVNALILEVQALKQQQQGVLSVDETHAALQASLRNIDLDKVSVMNRQPDTALAETRWEVVFTDAPATQLIEWLGSLPFIAQVQTSQLDLARSVSDGRERPGFLTGRIIILLPSGEAA